MLSQTSANNKLQNTPGIPDKPRKPKKRWRTVLKAIIIIVLVKILIIITLANYFSPDNKVKRYLHAKYGSNRELSVDGGCFAGLDGGQRHDATEWWQVIEWWRVILMIIYLALPLPDLSWWRLREWSATNTNTVAGEPALRMILNTASRSGWTITTAIAVSRIAIMK